jgi:thymidylate synthase (FAD)
VTTTEVLDHGYVKLIDSMGDDLAIVQAARVSYDQGSKGEVRDKKLIRYLMKNRHTSPFEAVVLKFEIKAPIFVVRQWHRHRTWSYNEVSARYTALPEEFYIPDPGNVGEQSASSKQARDIGQGHSTAALAYCATLQKASEEAFHLYRTAIAAGIPRELARLHLPLNTYTKFEATVDLHNLLHFLRLRLHPHAQHEIRVYADAMLGHIKNVVPWTTEAFLEILL